MAPAPDRVGALLREAAARTVMPRWQALGRHEVMAKGRSDVVTAADLECEDFLTPRLRDLLPGSVVVGEEAAARQAVSLDLLSGDAAVWLVDPVDGTRNFVDGRPDFAIMAALVRGGETVQAWILMPAADRLAVAERGAGAEIGGAPARVAAPAAGAAIAGMAGPRLRRRLQAAPALDCRAAAPSCAGHDYQRLAAGEIHFAVYDRLMPWDHAPGALLVEEAGGVVRHLGGSRYDPTGRTGAPALGAADPVTWGRLAAALAARPGAG